MHRYVIRPHPLLAERLNDRQVGHVAVMAALPQHLAPAYVATESQRSDNVTPTQGAGPRAAAGCLWRFDSERGELTVQADVPLRHDVLGTPIRDSPLVEITPDTRWRVDVVLACQKTPPSDVPVDLRAALKQSGRCYRSRMVVVPTAERVTWLCRKLSRLGFDAEEGSAVIGDVHIADLGRRGGGIPYLRAVIEGTAVDAPAWHGAIRNGIGRGRNFGLGLAYLTPLEEVTA